MESKVGVIWVRVSSEPQSHGYSPDNQLEILQAACRQKSIKVVKTFNVQESAKTSERRKLFREMLSFIQEGKVPFLVAKNTSRITRNYEDLYRIDDIIEKNGLHVFLVDENKTISKDSPPVDRFLFRVLGAVYQQENENRGLLARENMEKKARGGGLPYQAPFGYRNKDRQVVRIEEECEMVIQAFELYRSGDYSLESLREEFHRRGFPLSQRGVQEILKRPSYYGWFTFAGQLYKWNQEPLITKDLFDRVQARLRQSCSSPHKNARKWFAFKKFLRCGYCQSSITAEVQSGLTYYRCTFGKPYQNGRCPQKYFREEEIDKIISSEMASLNINGSWIDKLKEQLKADRQAEDKHIQNDKKRLEIELAKYQNRSAKLLDAWADGLISKDEYKQKKIEYSERIAQVESDLKGLDKINLQYKEQGAEILDLLRNFPAYYKKADGKGKQALLNVCLDQLILRGSQYQVNWKPPFDLLFPLALIKSKERGE